VVSQVTWSDSEVPSLELPTTVAVGLTGARYGVTGALGADDWLGVPDALPSAVTVNDTGVPATRPLLMRAVVPVTVTGGTPPLVSETV
jgi:hypothetical protein